MENENKHPLSNMVPYIIGPDLYELHTDAHLFVTQVFVNDNPLKLSNAEGNGSIFNQDYSVDGPIGYPNKAYLNAYLRPGENEVKVIFNSPLLEEVKGSAGETAFIQDMYAHVVVNKGELTQGERGIKSYYLDQHIADPNRSAHIIKDALLRRLTPEQLQTEVCVTHTMTIPPEQATQASSGDCDVSVSGFSSYKGAWYINGTKVYDAYDFGSMTTLDNAKLLLTPGENLVELEITEIENGSEVSTDLYIDCDMSSAVAASSLSEEHKKIKFGSFFNHVHQVILSFEASEPGKYSKTFHCI